MYTSFNYLPKPPDQKHSTVFGSVQSVPAVAVCTALQEVHKWNWTGVNCVCVCVCVCVGGELIFFVYLVVRHGYENIKVRYHNVFW